MTQVEPVRKQTLGALGTPPNLLNVPRTPLEAQAAGFASSKTDLRRPSSCSQCWSW
jgi:hypothetical protein